MYVRDDSAYAMIFLYPLLLYVVVMNVKAILCGLSDAFCDGSAEADDASTPSMCVYDVSYCPLMRFCDGSAEAGDASTRSACVYLMIIQPVCMYVMVLHPECMYVIGFGELTDNSTRCVYAFDLFLQGQRKIVHSVCVRDGYTPCVCVCVCMMVLQRQLMLLRPICVCLLLLINQRGPGLFS